MLEVQGPEGRFGTVEGHIVSSIVYGGPCGMCEALAGLDCPCVGLARPSPSRPAHLQLCFSESGKEFVFGDDLRFAFAVGPTRKFEASRCGF